MKLIDKDALVAEIERLISNGQTKLKESEERKDYESYVALAERIATCINILSFLDTLEVKEEILDKEGKTKLMQKCVHKAYKRGYDMGALQTTNKMNHNMKEVDLDKELDAMITPELKFHKALPSLFDVAKHFFELALSLKNS